MIDVDSLVEAGKTVSEFVIPIGDPPIEFPFKIPATYGGWATFNKERSEWVQVHKSAPCPNPEWSKLWPKDEASLSALYTLTTFCSELSMGEAVKLLAAPLIVDALLNGIQMHKANKTAEVYSEMIGNAKKNLSQTPNGDSQSPSVETPSESTPTS